MRDALRVVDEAARVVEVLGEAARLVAALEVLEVVARVDLEDDAPVEVRDARDVGADVREVVRDARVAGRAGCSRAEAQARAASMVPAPIAAATGHSMSPMAASRPSPP